MSDGTDAQWFDGKLLCSKLLDYGFEFEVREGELVHKSSPTADPDHETLNLSEGGDAGQPEHDIRR